VGRSYRVPRPPRRSISGGENPGPEVSGGRHITRGAVSRTAPAVNGRPDVLSYRFPGPTRRRWGRGAAAGHLASAQTNAAFGPKVRMLEARRKHGFKTTEGEHGAHYAESAGTA